MVNLSSSDLKKLKAYKSGNFATIYINGDKAYKIYNEEVKTDNHYIAKNPVLQHRLRSINKCNRLIRLNRKIQYTDLIEDIIYVDGKFAGVVLPSYDAPLFYDLMNEPIERRVELSRKLIKCARELTDHNIYPKDYKLINMFLVNGEAKLIDLDDVFTKVLLLPSKYHREDSIDILDQTIKAFLRENANHTFTQEILSEIERKKPAINYNYEGIESYLDTKLLKYRYVFIDGNFYFTDDRLLDGSRVVFVHPGYDFRFILSSIQRLKERGIIIYDVSYTKDLENYMIDNPYTECVSVYNDRVLRLK